MLHAVARAPLGDLPHKRSGVEVRDGVEIILADLRGLWCGTVYEREEAAEVITVPLSEGFPKRRCEGQRRAAS